jgi:hypothetical protein
MFYNRTTTRFTAARIFINGLDGGEQMKDQHDKWCACKECMEIKTRGRKESEINGLPKESIEKGS